MPLQAREYQDQGHRNSQPWIDSSIPSQIPLPVQQVSSRAQGQRGSGRYSAVMDTVPTTITPPNVPTRAAVAEPSSSAWRCRSAHAVRIAYDSLSSRAIGVRLYSTLAARSGTRSGQSGLRVCRRRVVCFEGPGAPERVDGALIGYPGLDHVVTGDRGVPRARMHIHGVAGHSGGSKAESAEKLVVISPSTPWLFRRQHRVHPASSKRRATARTLGPFAPQRDATACRPGLGTYNG